MLYGLPVTLLVVVVAPLKIIKEYISSQESPTISEDLISSTISTRFYGTDDNINKNFSATVEYRFFGTDHIQLFKLFCPSKQNNNHL